MIQLVLEQDIWLWMIDSFIVASEMKSINKNAGIQMIPPGQYLEFNLNNHQKELF